MTKSSLVKNFIYLSRYAGMREDLVQAGGGNSSVKFSSTEMLIKASGFQMAEIGETHGYSIVNPKVISAYFSNNKFEMSDEVERNLISSCVIAGPRPSIETFLHSFTKKYTLHTHPVVVNILASTDYGWKKLKELFPRSVFVEYKKPGIQLAKAFFDCVKKTQSKPDVVFLKNHGLIVSGEDADYVKEKTEEILLQLENFLHLNLLPYHDSTLIYDIIKKIPEMANQIVYLAQNINIEKGIAQFSSIWNYQFCPDCLVYCGKKALILPETIKSALFKNHLLKYGKPVIVIFKNKVYIIAESIKKTKEIESVLAFSEQIAFANERKEMNLLSEKEQNDILSWDAEKYRQSLK